MEIIDATISSELLSLSAFQIKLEVLISFRNNWCTLKIINYYLIVAFKVLQAHSSMLLFKLCNCFSKNIAQQTYKIIYRQYLEAFNSQ